MKTRSDVAISYAVTFRQSKTALFYWTLFRLDFSVPSSDRQFTVDVIVFVLFLEAVGVREYCCTAVEIGRQLCASRFLCEQRLREPSSHQVGGFELSRSRLSYVRGVALSREPPKLQRTQPLLAAWDRYRALLPAENRQSYSGRSRCWQHGIDTARCCRRVIHAAGEQS